METNEMLMLIGLSVFMGFFVNMIRKKVLEVKENSIKVEMYMHVFNSVALFFPVWLVNCLAVFLWIGPVAWFTALVTHDTIFIFLSLLLNLGLWIALGFAFFNTENIKKMSLDK